MNKYQNALNEMCKNSKCYKNCSQYMASICPNRIALQELIDNEKERIQNEDDRFCRFMDSK